MPFGDVAFEARGKPWVGESGPYMVGMEVKTLADLIGSRDSGRLSGHQLPGMLDGRYDAVWLVVQGIWKTGPEGTLQVPRGKARGRTTWVDFGYGRDRYMASEIEGFFTTVRIEAGVQVEVVHSSKVVDVAARVYNLYRWYQKDKHTSLKQFHKRRPTGVRLARPSRYRTVLSQYPDIEWELSKNIAARFKTVQETGNATEKEWREVEGIGEVRARRLVRFLQKGEE